MANVIINIKAANNAQEYFAKNNTYFQLIQLYPLKEQVIAEFTDDSEQAVRYMAFSEKGKGGYIWRSLDDAILGTILNLDCVNDAKIMDMLKTLKK